MTEIGRQSLDSNMLSGQSSEGMEETRRALTARRIDTPSALIES